MWYDEAGKRRTSVDEKSICGLFDQFRPLSNFHVCPVHFGGLKYMSSEAAYMACKTLDPQVKNKFTGDLKPNQAKVLGREIQLRSDWESYKVLAMTKVLTAKFVQNNDLGDLLVSTGERYIEETNDWNDKFWGADVFGAGDNMLGNVLMHVRCVVNVIRANRKFYD